MKLKNRMALVVFGMITLVLLMAMTFSIYVFSESYSSRDFYLPNAQSLTLNRNILENFNLRKVWSRNNLKNDNLEIKVVNETLDDSNKAAEIELSEREYQELLENGQLLSRPSKIPKPTPSDSQKSEAFLKARFAKECLAPKLDRSLDDNREEFPDLLQLLQEKKVSEKLWKTISRRTRITIQEVHEIELERNVTRMEEFHLGISDVDLYDENDKTVDALLEEMATMPIVHVEEKTGGTQLKLLITFYDGSQALLKPMS